MEESRDLPVRKTTLASQDEDDDYLRYTPSERFALVWPLTISVWAMKGIDIAEQRLQRDVEHIKRRGS